MVADSGAEDEVWRARKLICESSEWV